MDKTIRKKFDKLILDGEQSDTDELIELNIQSKTSKVKDDDVTGDKQEAKDIDNKEEKGEFELDGAGAYEHSDPDKLIEVQFVKEKLNPKSKPSKQNDDTEESEIEIAFIGEEQEAKIDIEEEKRVVKSKRVNIKENKDLNQFISNENKKLSDLAKRSKYSIYCEPRNASEHIQNLLSINMKIKQTKYSQEDDQKHMYERYKNLKENNFPVEELKNMLNEAKATLPIKKIQLGISKFFKRKKEINAVEVEDNDDPHQGNSKKRGSIQELFKRKTEVVDFDLEDKQGSSKKKGKQIPESTPETNDLQKLEESSLTSLGVTLKTSLRLSTLADSISEPILRMGEKYDKKLQNFYALDYSYKQNTSTTDNKSKIYNERKQVNQNSKVTKETLEDYCTFMTDINKKATVSGTIFERADLLTSASEKCKEFNDKLCRNLQQGLEFTSVANKTLRKRLQTMDSNLSSKRTEKPGIVSVNSSATWNEKIEELINNENLGKHRGVSLTPEEAVILKRNYDGHKTPMTIQDICYLLNKPSCEGPALAKLVVDNLPILKVTEAGNEYGAFIIFFIKHLQELTSFMMRGFF